MTIEEKIDELTSAVTDIADNLQPDTNDHGYKISDELHEIKWQLTRIADLIEKASK